MTVREIKYIVNRKRKH